MSKVLRPVLRDIVTILAVVNTNVNRTTKDEAAGSTISAPIQGV